MLNKIQINLNQYNLLFFTAIISIFQLFANLSNRIRISNHTKFEPNSNWNLIELKFQIKEPNVDIISDSKTKSGTSGILITKQRKPTVRNEFNLTSTNKNDY